MPRLFARTYLSIWEDEDFIALPHGQQWLYFQITSSVDLSWAGVHPLLPGRMARKAPDLTERKVCQMLDGLVKARFVAVDPNTDELAVRTHLKYSGVLEQPNLIRAANKAFLLIHSPVLQDAILTEMGNALTELFGEDIPQGVGKAIAEGFGKGFVKGFEKPIAEPILEGLT